MKMKELKEKVKEILKKHNIKISIGGCGCCGSPFVSFEKDGVKIVDDVHDFNIDMFEDNEPPQNQTLQQPAVSGIKSEHQIIDVFYDYYPTIKHAEFGELYCRDKVILLMREYAEQFKEHYWSPESIDRLKAEYFEKGINAVSSWQDFTSKPSNGEEIIVWNIETNQKMFLLWTDLYDLIISSNDRWIGRPPCLPITFRTQ